MSFQSSLEKLCSAIQHIDEGSFSLKSTVTDFKQKKKLYYFTTFKGALKGVFEADLSEIKDKNQEIVAEIETKREELKKAVQEKELPSIKEVIAQLIALEKKISYPRSPQKFHFKLPSLPKEIEDEMYADAKELVNCFESKCFRASIILCGRILETVLHRVYYEKTGNDLLEKAPGIGLGNLIAKMKDQGIDLDPALTQQIHLINQVRIYSVHKKQRSFSPSKDQAHAIILYTRDVVKKLFA